MHKTNCRAIFVATVLTSVLFTAAFSTEGFCMQPPTRPSPTPTPVYRPSTTKPVYQPKTAPSPTGTPTMKPPVYTAAGPMAPKLTKESLVGTWIGTATLTDSRPVANGFRFTLKNGELTGVWLNGQEEKPIQSKDIAIANTMFSIKITGPDYTITFAGYIAGETGDLKGTTSIDSLGQKSTGTWTAKRQQEIALASASIKDLISRGQQLMAAKDYSGAIKVFNQVLERDKEYVDAYRFRGLSALLMYESGTREGQLLYTAMFNFDDVIKRGSTSPDDYYLRGLTHERLGSKEKAIADYRTALRMYANHQGAKEALMKLGVSP